MLLDGIEGFPPIQNKNVTNSEEVIKVVKVAAGLDGNLAFSIEECKGIVLFAHGSGSSRRSTRNR